MLLGRIPGGGPLAQEPHGPVALVCGPRSRWVRPVRAAGSRPSAQGGPAARTGTTARLHEEAARIRPTTLEEKAVWHSMALTGDASSAAMRAVARRLLRQPELQQSPRKKQWRSAPARRATAT
jgi:hypothetical protein